MTATPYNPLDRKNLGLSVAGALLQQPVHRLSQIGNFTGAGIYAIYYAGDCDFYEALSSVNRNDAFAWPIYVGKAVPAGARKGLVSNTATGKSLQSRLKEHADSVRAAENLSLEHFFCRHLVVDDIWIPLGESLLISKFTPVWNQVIDGFGNHTPGRGRFNQKRSRWDVLHPGRAWAQRCQEREEAPELLASEARTFLESTIPTPASA